MIISETVFALGHPWSAMSKTLATNVTLHLATLPTSSPAEIASDHFRLAFLRIPQTTSTTTTPSKEVPLSLSTARATGPTLCANRSQLPHAPVTT
jgi:hypothetical protein